MLQNKILVFDLDGTLYQDVAEVDALEYVKIISFISSKLQITETQAQEVIADIRSRYVYDIDALEGELPFSKEEFLEDVCDVDVSFLSQAPELNNLLSQLSQRKFILTDSIAKHVADTLKAIGVSEDLFEAVFSAKDMDYLFKYRPQGFEKFLQRFSLKAQDCIVFEDSLRNLKIAKSLGFTTVHIASEASHQEDFVDYQFSDINTAIQQLLLSDKN